MTLTPVLSFEHPLAKTPFSLNVMSARFGACRCIAVSQLKELTRAKGTKSSPTHYTLPYPDELPEIGGVAEPFLSAKMGVLEIPPQTKAWKRLKAYWMTRRLEGFRIFLRENYLLFLVYLKASQTLWNTA